MTVTLEAHRGASELRWVDPEGRAHLAEAIGAGVSVDGGPLTPTASAAGPVRIGDRVYPGVLELVGSKGSGLEVRVRLGLEAYVEGVVASETSIWSAASAELEAQAIAARTYAAATLEQRAAARVPVQLTDGVMDQAFRGQHVPGTSARARQSAARLAAAVRDTRGVVLLRGTDLEEARYHACCGGHTSDFEDVFPREVRERGARGPAGTSCAPCVRRAAAESAAGGPDQARPLGWIEELSPATLDRVGRAFGLGGAPRRIGPSRTDAGGRWIDLALESSSGAVKRVPFEAFRKAVGYGVLRSGALVATVPHPSDPLLGGGWRVQGRGRGHGVGLCQEGARDLARAGWSARSILAHYYPGATLSGAAAPAEAAADLRSR